MGPPVIPEPGVGRDPKAILRGISSLRARGFTNSRLDELEQNLLGELPFFERASLRLEESTEKFKLNQKRQVGTLLRGAAVTAGGIERGVTGLIGLVLDPLGTGKKLQRELGVERQEGLVTQESLDAISEVFELNEVNELVSDITGELLTLVSAGVGAANVAARGLGMLSMSNRGMRLEKLTTMIAGAVGAGASEPLRTFPIPEGFTLLDPAGSIAGLLMEQGVPRGPALAAGGSVLGGAIGKLVGKIQAYRVAKAAKTLEPVAEKMRAARNRRVFFERQELIGKGERVGARTNAGELIAEELNERAGLIPRIVLPKEVSGALGRQMTRENALLSAPKLPRAAIDDGAVVEAIVKQNPQGVSVIQGVTATEARQAIKNLRAEGADIVVEVIRNKDRTVDLLVGTRNLAFTIEKTAENAASISIRRGEKVISGIVNIDDAGIATVSLGDVGAGIRASVNTAVTGVVDLAPDVGSLGVSGIRGLGIAVLKKFPKVNEVRIPKVSGAGAAEEVQFLSMPRSLLGDRTVPTGSALTSRLAAQYQREGAFAGQAVILADGTPMEYVGRTAAGKIRVRDPSLTTRILELDETSVRTMPVRFEDEFTLADDLVMSAMNSEEKALFTARRQEMIKELGKPIERFEDLEGVLGRHAGVFLRSARGGEIQVYDTVAGDVLRFSNIDAALDWGKNYKPIPPNLTPAEIANLGPGFSLSLFGGSSRPMRMNDMIRTPDYLKTFSQPGAISLLGKPMQFLLVDIEKAVGVPVWSNGFLPVQRAVRQAMNFETAWVTGKRLNRTGVKGLEQIKKIAGRGANTEKITDWLEVSNDAAKLRLVEEGMSASEIRAARELKQWYNVLFREFGLDAEKYLTDYAPHIRLHGEEFESVVTLWRKTRGDLLPKEIRFVHEEFRLGTLRIYEKDAFDVAARYLRGGSNKLFLNEPWVKAMQLVRATKDKAIQRPLFHFLEAVRGREFLEQKVALEATFGAILKRLGAKETAGVAENLALTFLGLSYQATMGARIGLAVRNLTQTIQTTWTLFGTDPGAFLEGLKVAMTTAGRDAAVKAGAITLRSLPVFAGEEFLEQAPRLLRIMSSVSLKLYTGADEFNRVVAFHVGKKTAERAITGFARRNVVTFAGGFKAPTEAKRLLLTESRMVVYDKPVVDEFLMLLKNDANRAAEFAGVQAANVTQFLYGRGNQPRWMRSVYGRFIGQFGTWPINYIDYTTRTYRNLLNNAGRGEALRFLGRLGIANAAIVLAGREVLNVDLDRWASFNSFFYTGGPVIEGIGGLAKLASGLPSIVTLNEDKFAAMRLAEGAAALKRVGSTFIPNFYAVRDISRIALAMERGDMTQLTASVLGTKPTKEWLEDRQLDAVEIFMQGDFNNPDVNLDSAQNLQDQIGEILKRQ